MSNNHPSSVSRFIMSCCAAICIAVIGANPAFAQTGIGVPGSASRTTFQVKGLDNSYVNASGGLLGRSGDSACPFADRDINKITAAFEAAKTGDPDSCPHADYMGGKIYFASCGAVYKEISMMSADVNNPEMNMNLLCCERPPGPGRDDCRNRAKSSDFHAKMAAGFLSKKVGVPPKDGGAWSSEDLKKFNEKKKAANEAEKQCFEDSFQRISEYWAQKRGVSCIRYVTRAVKALVTDGTRGLRSQMLNQVSEGSSSTMVTGTSPGATISTPSLWGLGVTIAGAANFAADVISLASQASDMLNTLSEECGSVVPELRQLQEWRKTVLGVNLCQAAENLLERQLTQCIRVNFTASAALKLPQFAVALQCPVNINLDVRLTPRGFDCYGSTSVGSPIVASTGRRSLLSGDGGLENLFNGRCFTSPTTRPEAGGNGTGGVHGTPAGTSGGNARVPGVDCGPLDPDPAKRSNMQGVNVLSQSRTANGWAVGGSETVNGKQVTRCDFFDANRFIRSAYVYGDGSSCRAQEGGFMASGYETNTACYGGYTPAAAPNIPDACMYDAGCLDANGRFDISKVGTSTCQSSTPAFDATRVYSTFVSGGVQTGSGNVGRSCADFADNLSEPIMCCDPQKQDCRQRDANTPLCVCDEGDAYNTVKIDLATNAPDVLGRCEQGGKKTCCSPRLNGGREACAAMQMPICEAEIADQCTATDDMVSYTGPDGITRNNQYTAAQVAQSKPSPYMYLFVRPDVTIPGTGQQCCTTEWCNVCPQHYANAYGLSLKRDSTYLLPSSDADNRNIIGKGWPFVVKETPEPTGENSPIDLDTMINTEYSIGVQEVQRLWVQFWWFGDRETSILADRVPLHVSDGLKLPVSITACNNLSYLKMKTVPSEVFSADASTNYGLGFGMNFNAAFKKKKPIWTVHAGIPEPTEYPIDYLNRLRRGVTDSEGTPLPPITLCNDVKICTPTQAGTVLQPQSGGVGGTGGTGNVSTFSPQTPTRAGLIDTVAPIRLQPSLGTITLPQVSTPTLTPGATTGGVRAPVTGGIRNPGANVGSPTLQPGVATPAQPSLSTGAVRTPGAVSVPSASGTRTPSAQPQPSAGAASSSNKAIGLY